MQNIQAFDPDLSSFINDGFDGNLWIAKVPIRVGRNSEFDPLPRVRGMGLSAGFLRADHQSRRADTGTYCGTNERTPIHRGRESDRFPESELVKNDT